MKKFLLLLAFLFTVSAIQAQIFILPLVKNSACGNNGGSIEVFVGGGSFPYTYSWTNGASTALNSNLTAGAYRVYVTDAIGDTSSLLVDVFNDSYIETAYGFLDYDPGFNFYYSCRTICNGGYRALEGLMNGTAPYTFTALNGTQNVLPNNNGIEFLGHCTGDTVKVLVSDANGCQGTFNQLLYGPTHPEMRVLDINGTCNNGNAGSAVFRIPNENGFTGNVTYEVYGFNTGINPVQFTPVSGVYTSSNLPQGHYSLNRVYASAHQTCDDDTIEFDVPNYGEYCANLSGIVWEDNNGDCLYDSVQEQGIAYQLLKVMPGSAYVMTDANGKYNITLPFGNYTIQWINDASIATCGSQSPSAFTLTYNNSAAQVNFSGAPGNTCNLVSSLQAASYNTVPGNSYAVTLSYSNSGLATANGAKLYYYINPNSFLQQASINPDSSGNGILMWNLGNLPQGGSGSISLTILLTSGAVSGSTQTDHTYMTSAIIDNDYSNNSCYLNFIAGSSFYEANKKNVNDALGNKIAIVYVDQDNTLNYTIDFQNTTADTVYNVTVIDTLSQFVDINTFQLVASSHTCQLSVDSARIARFTFPGIVLPSSAVSEAASKGFVRYRVDVPPGFVGLQAHVYNQASIYLDEHPPIESNLTDVFIDIFVGMKEESSKPRNMKLYPNPVHDNLVVRLTQQDRSNGAIQIYSLDGRLQLEQKVTSMQVEFDMHNLAAGTYLLRYSSESQNSTVFFVKN